MPPKKIDVWVKDPRDIHVIKKIKTKLEVWPINGLLLKDSLLCLLLTKHYLHYLASHTIIGNKNKQGTRQEESHEKELLDYFTILSRVHEPMTNLAE